MPSETEKQTLMLKKLDRYIIRKFLETFFFSLLLIIVVVIVFDYSERADNFERYRAPMKGIWLDYYLNVAPYFATLFSPIFTFIAVVFFTSKMASNSEIIAILSNGISFKRMLRPYFIGAAVIALFSFSLTNFVLPPANKVKNDFYNKYINRTKHRSVKGNDVYMQIERGTYLYVQRYWENSTRARYVTLKSFENHLLTSTLFAESMKYDEEKGSWTLQNYQIRDVDGMKETFTEGRTLDTVLNLSPQDFIVETSATESMTLTQLDKFIEEQEIRGDDNIIKYKISKYERFSTPFATFILTLIGAALASRKVRGGIGLHLGIGLLISFSYLMLMKLATVFAATGAFPALAAVWAPNILYGFIAYWLYRIAPK